MVKLVYGGTYRLRFCCFSRSQSVWLERCLLVPDVCERQDTAKELATAHDTPEARESEQKPRSHTTVNVDSTRCIYDTTLFERTRRGQFARNFDLQILLPRWKTIAVVTGGGNRRKDHRCFSNSPRSSCLSCSISHHHQGKTNHRNS